MTNTFDETVNTIKNYYIKNNKPFPKTVKEYQNDYPKGFRRQKVKELIGLTCKELLALINDDESLLYRKPLQYYINPKEKELNITWIDTVSIGTQTKHTVVRIRCNDCSYEQDVSVGSLILRKFGCNSCKTKNARIKDNPKLFYESLDRLNVRLVDNLPDNNLDRVKVECLDCFTVYYVLPVRAMHPPTDNTATCPNCRDTDRRVVYNEITFDSQLERNVFIELKKQEVDFKYNIPYKNLATCSRQWRADFIINDCIIEVSNFSKDYRDYHDNLDEKRDWASKNNIKFYHVKTVSGIKKLLKDIV